jgi:hypothetical protein
MGLPSLEPSQTAGLEIAVNFRSDQLPPKGIPNELIVTEWLIAP